MIVVPLIMSSLIYSISSFTSVNDISGIGFKAILFYLFSSLAAIIIGIFVVNLIQPGLVNGEGASNLVGLNLEYVTPALDNKLAATIDYSTIKLNNQDGFKMII